MRSIVWLWAAALAPTLLLAASAPAADTGAAAMDRPQALHRLDSVDVVERRLGVERLGVVGDMSDVPRLLPMLDDEDGGVRTDTERAIWSIWSRSGDPEVDRLFAEGAEHLANRRLVESVQVFSRIIELKPDFAEGWNKRATALFLAGDFEASAADCDEVLKRNPAHFGALSGYGLISLRLGRLEQALNYFQQALTLNPNMPGVRANIEAIRGVLTKSGRHET